MLVLTQYNTQLVKNESITITLLRVIPTMTCQCQDLYLDIYLIYSIILFDIYSGILSGILSDIYSDILPGTLADKCCGMLPDIHYDILAGILSGSLSGILSDIYSDLLPGIILDMILTFYLAYMQAFFLANIMILKSSGAHCDRTLADKVQRCTLRSDPGG